MKLKSINSKSNTQISFVIKLLDQKFEQGQKWQYYEIVLQNGAEIYNFKSLNKETVSNVGTRAEIGKFAFVKEPIDELQKLKDNLQKFLQSQSPSFRFEPSDPSFELIIERLAEINQEKNYKVYFWIDAGNTKDLEYTWDALGVRFITSENLIKDFINS